MNNVPIADIDYVRLAKLADDQGVPFHRICARAEKGATTDLDLCGRLRKASDSKVWITPAAAAVVLGMPESTIHGNLCAGNYYGIRVKSRNPNLIMTSNGKGRRGCGIFINRKDLEEVRRIRDELQLSWRGTLKIFQAKLENRL